MKHQRTAVCVVGLILALFVIGNLVASPPAGAATPGSGSVSPLSPSTGWQGKTFVLSNPSSLVGGQIGEDLGCRNFLESQVDPACDTFGLTVTPLDGHYAVDIAIQAADGNDFDLFVFNDGGELIGLSAGETGNERITLTDLAAGTYSVVTEAWLVAPAATYSGAVSLLAVSEEETARSFFATPVPPSFEGTPANLPAGGGGQPLQVVALPVGREAAEPTMGINRNGTAFYAAATFDALPDESPTSTARTKVLRSRDQGATWQSVQPVLSGELTEPPTTLDPYVYVDETTGRVFNIELYVGCSYLLFSDDEGATWQRNPIACGDFVNDHQTLFTGPPPAGLETQGYPNVVYYCFNRVADSSCGRSLDGGRTFLPTRDPAYLGVDGGVCGGLHSHGTTDSEGRVFLPKGHCGQATVAISEDGGDSWERVVINDYLVPADHEVNVAVDAADNVYAVWWDDADQLPYLAVSADHGSTWSTPFMIAPPGVHEVNFPTLVAGDPGRIALSFPGTTSTGRGDLQRAWSYYVLVSVSALDEKPRFTWTTANPESDPIHRGNCGPGRCGNMLDFLDIVVSPLDGRVWATAVDTCDGTCASGETGQNAREGLAVRQVKGPTLRDKRR